jgi:Cu/Ag efflux protein CusF
VRKTLVTTLALVLMLSFTLATASNAAEPDKGGKASGTVKKVDMITNTVTVETAGGQEASFTVDPQTRITVAGKTGTLADLKEGQRVTVEHKGGKAVAIES